MEMDCESWFGFWDVSLKCDFKWCMRHVSFKHHLEKSWSWKLLSILCKLSWTFMDLGRIFEPGRSKMEVLGDHIEVQGCFSYQRPTRCAPNYVFFCCFIFITYFKTDVIILMTSGFFLMTSSKLKQETFLVLEKMTS